MATLDIVMLTVLSAVMTVIAIQLITIRRNLAAKAVAEAFQQTSNQRIEVWNQQLEKEALHSAQDKFFEHELYKRDVLFPEIEELTLRERRAIMSAYNIELLYFQNLFHQRQHGAIDQEQGKPLNYMRCMMDAPQRRYWKDYLRQSNHYPVDYVAHVDSVVKKYDRVEQIMDNDQDAEFEAAVLEVFEVPPPPEWIHRP